MANLQKQTATKKFKPVPSRNFKEATALFNNLKHISTASVSNTLLNCDNLILDNDFIEDKDSAMQNLYRIINNLILFFINYYEKTIKYELDDFEHNRKTFSSFNN
jgi:hypothetical protein